VVQDTVLSYAELEKWEQRLDRLREVYPDVQKMEAAVADRVKEGVDSEMDGSRARLSVARVRMRLAEASGAADVLRERLSKLTGLPSTSIETEADSVPALPQPLRMKICFRRRPTPTRRYKPRSNTRVRSICA